MSIHLDKAVDKYLLQLTEVEVSNKFAVTILMTSKLFQTANMLRLVVVLGAHYFAVTFLAINMSRNLHLLITISTFYRMNFIFIYKKHRAPGPKTFNTSQTTTHWCTKKNPAVNKNVNKNEAQNKTKSINEDLESSESYLSFKSRLLQNKSKKCHKYSFIFTHWIFTKADVFSETEANWSY